MTVENSRDVEQWDKEWRLKRRRKTEKERETERKKKIRRKNQPVSVFAPIYRRGRVVERPWEEEEERGPRSAMKRPLLSFPSTSAQTAVRSENPPKCSLCYSFEEGATWPISSMRFYVWSKCIVKIKCQIWGAKWEKV